MVRQSFMIKRVLYSIEQMHALLKSDHVLAFHRRASARISQTLLQKPQLLQLRQSTIKCMAHEPSSLQ